MIIVSDINEMRRRSLELRHAVGGLALVPTMGALHAGHLSLVNLAREHAGAVVVSVFVNPTQFGPDEDFGRYPRTLDEDVRRLEDFGGVELVFAPGVEDMYPGGVEEQAVQVVPGDLVADLCGRFRPGHFEGVATVVVKLFNACVPSAAVFGMKDAQQFVMIRRLVRDLNYGIQVIGAPTVRESDGLAMSSRNAYLSTDQRRQAGVLFEAVSAAESLIRQGELEGSAIVDAMMSCVARAPLARLQYAQVVDAGSLQPLARLEAGAEVLAALAVFFGDTRLIDNVFVRVPGG